MAKFTPFLGNISGKINAVVFASGKGGAYLRSFRKPTNPSTAAQIRARAAFGSSSRSWSGLSSVIKAAWNVFAISSFSPKNPKPGVIYSGCSAYTSMLNQIKALNSALSEPATLEATPTDFPLTETPFAVQDFPPVGLFAPSIINVDGLLNAPLTLVSADYKVTDTPSFTITVSMASSGVDPEVFGVPVFRTPTTAEKFGFALYASSRIPSGSTSPAQIQKFLVGVIPPITLVTPGVFSDGPEWTFNGVPNPNLIDSKYTLKTGDSVIYEVYAVSISGSSALIGSYKQSVS